MNLIQKIGMISGYALFFGTIGTAGYLAYEIYSFEKRKEKTREAYDKIHHEVGAEFYRRAGERLDPFGNGEYVDKEDSNKKHFDRCLERCLNQYKKGELTGTIEDQCQ